MTNTCTPRLRPNTFITLLLRATRSDFGNGPLWWEKGDISYKRNQLLIDLIKVLDPAYRPKNEQTLASYMSSFMNGERPYSKTYYPFDTVVFQHTVNCHLNESKSRMLSAMDKLCKEYFNMDDDTSLRFLVGGLIETILLDDTFNDSFTFPGYPIAKTDLVRLTTIPLQSFLLDVWYLVVTQHHNSAEGAETYEQWTADDGRAGAPPSILTTIGDKMMKNITVSTELIDEPSMDTTKGNAATQKEEEPIIQTQEDYSSSREHQSSECNEQGEGSACNQTFINNGIYIAHQEGKISNIPHVENLVINMGD